jgi:hypothetical protein
VLFIGNLIPHISPAFNDSLNDSLVAIRDPYRKVLRKYTREGAIYNFDQLDTNYKWFATYHSPEFLEAFQKQYQKLYPEDQAGLADKLKRELLEADKTEFFIALYAKARGLKRMTGENNLWVISLLVGDKVLHPIAVENISLTPFQYHFYPYLDKWYLGYRVVFPLDASQIQKESMTLQLSSVAGNSKVTFIK